MLKNKLVSFDLQGTLSDSAFSDEFWLELLPSLYAKKYAMSCEEAQDILQKEYETKGKYHELFYDHRKRLDEVIPGWEFQTLISLLKNRPSLDAELVTLIQSMYSKVPMILLSATTTDFITLELGDTQQYFKAIYSTIDDFKTPGKPSKLYTAIANSMNIKPEECLHIGDCIEMDYDNAINAGWQSFHFNKKTDKQQRFADLKNKMDQFLCG